jgi:hypothetical protein
MVSKRKLKNNETNRKPKATITLNPKMPTPTATRKTTLQFQQVLLRMIILQKP